MADSLLDELQCAQLMAKEQHRRKRRLERLNKMKRHKFVKYSKKHHTKYHCKHRTIYLAIEMEYQYEDSQDTYQYVEIEDITNTDQLHAQQPKKRRKYIKKNHCKCKQQTEQNEISLSASFKRIECSLYDHHKEIMRLEYPKKFIYNITSLYESSTEIENHIHGLLNSARYWTCIEGQSVVIGSYLDELIHIFRNVLTEYPLDIIYMISELVGNAIIWLRRPGLNIFKWSVQSDFFFSGYLDIDSDYLDRCQCSQYVDLDWYFVVFLLLGLIPKHKTNYFMHCFNQKLLSALPGTYPLKLLFK
eukprot:826441_1